MRRLIEKYGKYVIWIVLISFLLGALIIFTPGRFDIARRGSPESRKPALIINGEKITQGQFDARFDELLRYYRELYRRSGLGSFDLQLQGASGAVYRLRLQTEVAQELIRRTILNQEAEKRGIKISKAEYEAELTKEVDRQLQAILSYYQMTEDELKERLAQEGRTLEDFKGDIRRELERRKDMLIERLRDEKLRDVVVGGLAPSDEELRAYFEENKPRFAKPEMIRARHILIKVAEDAPEEEVAQARSRIEEIKKKLDEGADFAELAKEYSEDEGTAEKGGDLGWFQRGQMVKEFEEAAFALQPGEISEPVRSKYGFHIIKLEDRRPASTFEEVKEEVRAAYLEEERERRFEDWYQGVREAAEVEIKLPILAAYMLEEEDPDAALLAYEQLAAEGGVKDLYLPYYIARLYEKKLEEAKERKEELEAVEEPELDEEEIKAVEAEIAEYTEKVKENLYKTLDTAGEEEELFEKLLNYDEENPELHYRYAAHLKGMGSPDRALEQLERTLELAPDHARALILYGDIKLEEKSYDEAIAKYEQALGLIGEEGKERLKRVRTKLAQGYMGKEDYPKAEELLAKVLETYPEDQQVLVLMGDVLMAQERFAEAADRYKKALLAGVKPELQVKLGKAHLKAGSLKEAREAFEAVIKRGGFYAPDAYLGLGDVRRAQGLREKALEDYKDGFERSRYRYQLREELGERILELDPDDVETRFDLAKTYQRDRKYEEAIAHYLEFLKRQTDSFEAYQELAECYTAVEDYAGAKEAYKQALRLTEEDETRMVLLYQKILEAEERLVGEEGKLGEDGLEALLNLAKLYIKQEKRERAREQLDRLVEENPDYKPEEVAALLAELEKPQTPAEEVEIPPATETGPEEGP